MNGLRVAGLIASGTVLVVGSGVLTFLGFYAVEKRRMRANRALTTGGTR
jgi:hypothetical protein